MKQIIEIEVPDGKKAVWKDGKIMFEDIKPQLPKTWEEFCELHKIQCSEYYIGTISSIEAISSEFDRNQYEDKNILPSRKAAEAHLALMQLHQLRDCYRQGWEPNYSDTLLKYNITIVAGDITVIRSVNSRHFLSFQTEEVAMKFLENFRSLIYIANDLIG